MAVLHYNFHSHPKMIGLSNAAVGIYARMLSYASANVTDGFVPAAFIRQISGKSTAKATLEQAGLIVKCPGGHNIRDYLDYNPSREEVMEKRRKARERAQQSRGGGGGKNPKSSREQKEERTPNVRDIGKDNPKKELQPGSPSTVVEDAGLDPDALMASVTELDSRRPSTDPEDGGAYRGVGGFVDAWRKAQPP